MQVLNSDTHSTHHQMGIRVAGLPGQRLILFDHASSRSAHVAMRLLEGACSYVQSDGYAAYDAAVAALPVTHVGCFAHARRRFFEAIKALPKAQQQNNTVAHDIVRSSHARVKNDARCVSAARCRCRTRSMHSPSHCTKTP